MQGHLIGKGEEDRVPLRGSRNCDGGDAAGVAASQGGASAPVDGGGSSEFLKHGKRGGGEELAKTKKMEKRRLEVVLTEEWQAAVPSR
jgi:hypothetical protein